MVKIGEKQQAWPEASRILRNGRAEGRGEKTANQGGRFPRPYSDSWYKGKVKVHILPKLGSSDHRTIIYAELDLGLVGIEEPPKQRKVLHWGKARWGELKKEVKKTDFNFEGLGVQEAVDTVTAKLQE